MPLPHLRPLAPPPRTALWWCLALVVLCAAVATQSRLSQIRLWVDNPQQYVADGVPMMTTLDAWYTLRLARLQARDAFVPHGPAPQRHYTRPEQGDAETWYVQREPRTLPLISRLVAALSVLHGGDIDQIGLRLAPWLASLFMLPLFLCLWQLGLPAAGVLGGLVGTFCLAYYRRSSLGWLDTDALNLFFPWLASALLLGLHAAQSRQRQLLLAFATGLTLHAGALWYPKPVITLLYLGAAVLHLALADLPWRRLALCVAVLVLAADPTQFADLVGSISEQLRRYLGAGTGAMSAPQGLSFVPVWPTISEDATLPWAQRLGEVLASPVLVGIGLLACLPMLLQHWRRAAALAPLLALAVLALLSSRRFIPYLAPWVGIGWGWLLVQAWRALPARAQRPLPQALGPSLLAVALFALAMAPASGLQHVPRPAVPAPVFRELQLLAHRLPADARLWTWWDLGFAIQDATGRGVYHDGSAQYTPQTNLIAASLVSPQQQVLHATIRFVDREGNQGIRQLARSANSMPQLLRRIGEVASEDLAAPVYVLFTADMLGKYNAMRALGSAPGTRPSYGVQSLACDRIEGERLFCDGQVIDLQAGQITPERPPAGRPAPVARLRRVVWAAGSAPIRQHLHATESPWTVQIVQDGPRIVAVYLLDEEAFASNLNRMYLLGDYDTARFEPVFDDFPHTRVYRVRAPQNPAPRRLTPGGAG
ncbi:MAG: hypothetical protein JNM97_21330 [Rhodoferax sp.]|nr:hypothetical protein [Rhodoferax sp.]